MNEYVFGIGMRASRVEHVATDAHGREVDPVSETDTQRSERIRALQDSWQPHDPPAAEPVAVLAEWMAASPANRMSAFATMVAEHPERLPDMELEPARGEEGRPGGLYERMRAQAAARTAQAQRNITG